MNEQLKTQAEQIFREKLMKSYLDFGFPESHAKLLCDKWFESLANTNLLYDVIIPSLVQALEANCLEKQDSSKEEIVEEYKDGTIKFVPVDPEVQQQMNKFGKELGNKEPSKDRFSKIQPGQKLKDGDYFEGGTKAQYLKLFKIENCTDPEFYAGRCRTMGHINYGGSCLRYITKEKKTKYDFSDFKQLCINTFGDGK